MGTAQTIVAVFQLPFRDSYQSASYSSRTVAFNSLFGIPKRDVREYATSKLFQLPFRDSKISRSFADYGREAFNSLFGILV